MSSLIEYFCERTRIQKTPEAMTEFLSCYLQEQGPDPTALRMSMASAMNIDPEIKSAYLGAFQFIRSGINNDGLAGLPYFHLLHASLEALKSVASQSQVEGVLNALKKDLGRELSRSSNASVPGLLGHTSNDTKNISSFMAMVDDGEKVLNHVIKLNLPGHFSSVYAVLNETNSFELLDHAKRLIYTSPYNSDIPLIREIALGSSEKSDEELVYRTALPFFAKTYPEGGFEETPELPHDFIENYGLNLAQVIFSGGIENRSNDPLVLAQRKKCIELLVNKGLPIAYAMKIHSNKADLKALNNGAGVKSSFSVKNQVELMRSVVSQYNYGVVEGDTFRNGMISNLSALLITAVLRALPEEDRNQVLYSDSIRHKYYEETRDASVLSNFDEKSSLKRVLTKDLGM